MLHKYVDCEKKFRAWQDSNLQSPDPKSGALSIRPHTQDEHQFWTLQIESSFPTLNRIYTNKWLKINIYGQTLIIALEKENLKEFAFVDHTDMG